MKTQRKYKSKAFEAIHSSASALHKVVVIDQVTMNTFDQACVASIYSITPTQIKKIRQKNHVSQPVFARYLNTCKSTIQKWEIGAKSPSGMALKLLSVVQKHGLQVLE